MGLDVQNTLSEQRPNGSPRPFWSRLLPRDLSTQRSAKLQTLVYDILPSTTAITDYDIGLEELSANGQFFVGSQIAVNV